MSQAAVDQLFSGEKYSFADFPDPDMPVASAGVYTIWDKNDRFLYVGMAGRMKSSANLLAAEAKGKTTGLKNRLRSHASGIRSGDQFCVYVADLLVLPTMTPDDIEKVVARELTIDRLVREFVRGNLDYRYVVTTDGSEAIHLENSIIHGEVTGLHPLLNPPSHLRKGSV
jgi:hypothetical protein